MTLDQLAQRANADFDLNFKRSQQKVKDYEATGLLEGLTGNDKVHMATLLDNQLKQLMTESTTMTNQGGASFSAGTGEQYAGIVLPMVRKLYAETISAKEFVSVQPLSVPNGLVFYLDFKYGTTKSPFTAGDSVYGTLDTFNQAPTGGLYGAGRYGYSINMITASVSTTVTSGSWSDVLLSSTLSGSAFAGELKKVTVPLASLPDYDEYGISAFYLSGSGVLPANILAQFTTADTTNVTFIVTGSSAGVLTGTAVASYQKKTKDNFRGDYEDRTGTLAIADFQTEFTSSPITAKSRKLKGSWTQEAQKDIFVYQGINLEAEITSMMADSIGKDVDLEILAMLLQAVPKSGSREFWTAENNVMINPTQTGFQPMSSGYYNSQQQWFATLGTKINKVSNSILQKTARGSANYMVISPRVANIVESMAGYMSDADVDKTTSSFGANRSGTFNSQYKVYKNPYYNEDKILMGFKGSNYLECGAVYAPYVGLETTPPIYNPSTGTPTKIISTRYGKKVLRGEFHGDVVIGGLNTI
jgi:hypothetical protein